jgi:4-hydroxy-2-oxoheptanedioate aldolase
MQMRSCPTLAELAAECEYDFLFVDGEHGVFTAGELAQSLKACAATNVFAFARVPRQDPNLVRGYLEAGAEAIIVPHVSTVEEAKALVGAMSAHKEACLIVIIESVLGAKNAQEILSVDGVDGVFVGPNDLTADLGYHGNYTHPNYHGILSCIECAAAATGKILGTVAHGPYTLEALHSRGHRMLVLGSEQSIMRDALNAEIAKIKLSFPAK